MEVEAAPGVLARVEGKLFVGSVLVVFVTCQLSNAPLLVLLLWCCAAGLLTSYFLFRNLPRLPNLLLHIQHPSRSMKPSRKSPSSKPDTPLLCPVCSQAGCKRHRVEQKREYLNPWEDLAVTQSVDTALSEILELVMRRFVYSWHRPLAPASEAMEDEMRVAIRHAAAILLRRAQGVDLPQLITSKLLQAIASHIHVYARARERLPVDASVAEIEAAVMKEYGDHTHSAMRGPTGNLRYFRDLTRTLLPLLLPDHILQSRMMCSLLEEIFASKVFVPAMNFTAKPDFLNKVLLIIFDKNSRLERVFGPETREVSFLAKWAVARSRRSSMQQRLPLDIPLPELLDPQHHLYAFMQYMKSLDNIYILQVYLSLNDLKQKVSSFEADQAECIVKQVEDLHTTYLLPSSHSYLQLDHTFVASIATVLSDSSLSAAKKCERLKQLNVFGRLRGYIYTELLLKIYYPRFLRSKRFYELYLGKREPETQEPTSSSNTPTTATATLTSSSSNSKLSKGHRWRQKTKHLKNFSQRKTSTLNSTASIDAAALEQDSAAGTALGTEPSNPAHQVVKSVQIVDAESHLDGIRPYTMYVIMSRRQGEGETDAKFQLVKRRYKEFVGLDTKLRQFQGEGAMNIILPSKKTFRNMEKGFIDTRCKELEQYLSTLITYPRIERSQILASFLSPDSDPSLFLPNSVKGMVRKAVLKRDKSQHHEDLIQALSQFVEPASNQPNPKTVAEVTAQSQTNKEHRDGYIVDAVEDLSRTETKARSKPWLYAAPSSAPSMEGVEMLCVMDLVLFVAESVYKTSSLQLTALMMAKLLAQDTVEALAYRFVSHRVELMLTEAHLLRLILLFRDNLFFLDATPRREEDIRKRFQEAFDQLLHYPNPLVVKAIGEERFLKGTGMIVEGLQCRELNKQLFFKLLDIILLELFPELAEAG